MKHNNYRIDYVSDDEIVKIIVSKTRKRSQLMNTITEFWNSGQKIACISSNNTVNTSNVNCSIKSLGLNMRCFKIDGKAYIANLTLVPELCEKEV